MIRILHSICRQNTYFLSTFVLGMCLSIFISPFFVQKKCIFDKEMKTYSKLEFPNIDIYEPKINLAGKPKIALKIGHHGMIRPRFHKSELGIRNKLFIGVLTSPESISSLAVALNKTASKFVNKMMFFIDAPSAQRLNVSLLKLPGIVGFTDTRKALKPFHLMKYVSDNFLEDFDYFFIVKDAAYIQAQKLVDFVKKISINNDIHVGHVIEGNDSTNNICSLDFGILLSNSVVRKMQSSLELCVKSLSSKDDNINIGHCIIHTTQLPCSEFAQASKFQTYPIKKSKAECLLPKMNEERLQFDQSLVIAPLSKPEQYYNLHFYFSMVDAEKINEAIDYLRNSAAKSPISKSRHNLEWPVASQPAVNPFSHFDMLRWDHFTLSQKYLSNDFSNVAPLSAPGKEDILKIVEKCISYVERVHEGVLKYQSFVNGYKRFDASRGMDYIVDLAFRETTSGNKVYKRLEVFKSLGKVESVAVPYVTENVRVHVIIPVRSSEIERIMIFLKQYSINAMEKKDLQFLMLVFIYDFHESSKGMDDIFKDVKNKALTLSNKFEKHGNLIKWHSVKLMSNTTNFMSISESLVDIAAMDSVLKKFSLESLILIGKSNMEVRLDYFNRVRMNTVLGFQIFSPIPFSEYNPDIIYNENRPQPPELDINKNYGHYDSNNFKHISFYVDDYSKARKKIQDVIPIIKYDRDIGKLMPPANLTEERSYNLYATNGIYNMFVRHSPVHVMRAVEPSLRMRHATTGRGRCSNTNLAPRSYLGRLFLDYQIDTQS